MPEGDAGVSNLEKSAFWIYGVTAMIMREPLSSMLRHGVSAGWGDPQVHVEALRVLVVLGFLSRLFLAAGLHFETVYMRAGSGALYPKRSYPVDFLAGLVQLLFGVAASTTVSLHTTSRLDVFVILSAALLLSDVLWFIITAALGFSAVKAVARRAVIGAGILSLSLLALPLGEGPVLVVMMLLSLLDTALLIGKYGQPAPV